jgi:SAM-dependent methyltransferase
MARREFGMAGNQQQVPAWDEESTSRWLREAEGRERALAPVADALLDAADLRAGHAVLDIGCGTGITTVAAAAEVGLSGTALGVDISPPMIEYARQHASSDNVGWLVADAQTYPFQPGGFDRVISRFGVMFFEDPERAFGNLAAATRDGGRLAMAVWLRRDEAAYFREPLRVVVEALTAAGAKYELSPPDRGPFSLGDPQTVVPLLERAGWSAIACRPDHRMLYVGGPGVTVEEAVRSALGLGQVRTAMEGQPAEIAARARQALLKDFTRRHDGTGVGFPAGFQVVTAERRPADRS